MGGELHILRGIYPATVTVRWQRTFCTADFDESVLHNGPAAEPTSRALRPAPPRPQVVKPLDAPLDCLVGQLVLESFTYDEGTYPATACDFVARTVFSEAVPTERRALHRRSVLMILDGMTLEQEPEDYRSALQPAGIDLLVLNIKVGRGWRWEGAVGDRQ
jgi:hypothetical protein